MFNKEEIENIIEKFHLSCNLPISAYEHDGTFISSCPYNIIEKFDGYDIVKTFKRCPKKLFKSKKIGDAVFSACPISSDNIYSGTFLIGPYTDNSNSNSYIYKDPSIMEELISLLHMIVHNTVSKNHEAKHYGLNVKKTINYIQSRYRENIRLDDVADYLEINKCYLCSLIKKETGITFTMLLNKIRIEKSKDLLKDNKSTILDVALAVGYNNQNYFNVMFKKNTDLTPMAYKRCLQAKRKNIPGTDF